MTITIFEFILLCVCAALLLIIYNIILIWREFDRMLALLAEMERAWLRHLYPDPEPEPEQDFHRRNPEPDTLDEPLTPEQVERLREFTARLKARKETTDAPA